MDGGHSRTASSPAVQMRPSSSLWGLRGEGGELRRGDNGTAKVGARLLRAASRQGVPNLGSPSFGGRLRASAPRAFPRPSLRGPRQGQAREGRAGRLTSPGLRPGCLPWPWRSVASPSPPADSGAFPRSSPAGPYWVPGPRGARRAPLSPRCGGRNGGAGLRGAAGERTAVGGGV